MARGRFLDEQCRQELCGSMSSGSGQVAERTSETGGRNFMVQSRSVRVAGRLMQAPAENEVPCFDNELVSSQHVPGAPHCRRNRARRAPGSCPAEADSPCSLVE